jgi:hypothetical protein
MPITYKEERKVNGFGQPIFIVSGITAEKHTITERIAQEIAREISQHRDMNSFTFSNCDFQGASFEILLHSIMDRRVPIESLKIEHNNLNPYQLTKLEEFLNRQNITGYFSLEMENISENPGLIIQLAAKNSETICLDSTVDPVVLRGFAAGFVHNQQTNILTVYKVNDDLMGHVADILRSNEHLKMLTIRSQEEDAPAADGAAAAAAQPKFGRISLDSAQKLADALAINRTLTTLDLGCTISPEGLQAILEAAKLNVNLQTFTYDVDRDDPAMADIVHLVDEIEAQVAINAGDKHVLERQANKANEAVAEAEKEAAKAPFNVKAARQAKLDALKEIAFAKNKARIEIEKTKAAKEGAARAAAQRDKDAREDARKKLEKDQLDLKNAAEAEKAEAGARAREELDRRARAEEQAKREAEEEALRKEAAEKARKIEALEILKQDINTKLSDIKTAVDNLNQCLSETTPLLRDLIRKSEEYLPLSENLRNAEADYVKSKAEANKATAAVKELAEKKKAIESNLAQNKQAADALAKILDDLHRADAEKEAKIAKAQELVEANTAKQAETDGRLTQNKQAADALSKTLDDLRRADAEKDKEIKAAEENLIKYLATKQETSEAAKQNTKKLEASAAKLAELKAQDISKTEEIKAAEKLLAENIVKAAEIESSLQKNTQAADALAKKLSNLKLQAEDKKTGIQETQQLISKNAAKQVELTTTLAQYKEEASEITTKLEKARTDDAPKKAKIAKAQELLDANAAEQENIKQKLDQLIQKQAADNTVLQDYIEKQKSGQNLKQLDTKIQDSLQAKGLGEKLIAFFSKLFGKKSSDAVSSTESDKELSAGDKKTEQDIRNDINQRIKKGLEILENDILKYKTEIEEKETALVTAQTKGAELKAGLEALTAEVAAIEASIKAIEQENAEKSQLAQKQDNLLSDAKKQEASLKDKVLVLEGEQKSIEAEIKAADVENAALNAVIQKAREDLKSIQANEPTLNQRVNDLNAEQRDIKTEINDTEIQHAAISGVKIDAVDPDQEKRLEDELQALKNDKEAINKSLLEAQQKHDDIVKAVVDDTALAAATKIEAETLKAGLEELQNENKEIKNTIEAKKAETTILDNAIETDTTALDTNQNEEAALRENANISKANESAKFDIVRNLEPQASKANSLAIEAICKAGKHCSKESRMKTEIGPLYNEYLALEKNLTAFNDVAGDMPQFIEYTHQQAVKAMGDAIKFCHNHD